MATRLAWIGKHPIATSGVLIPAAFFAVLAGYFTPAYVCVACAALSAICAYFCSTFLRDKRIKRGYQAIGLLRGKPSIAEWLLLNVGLSLVILSPFLFAEVWVRSAQIENELNALDGWLYPANEIVESQCKPNKPGDLVVIAGTNAYVENTFPHTLIALNCDRVLVADRDQKGNIGLTLAIYDRDGRVVVNIEKGHFDINRNNYFKIDRKGSRSTLSITDQFNQEVLYLHLANAHTLQMRSRFYYKGKLVVIDDTHPLGIAAGSYWLQHSCMEHSISASVQIGQCAVR